MMIDCRICGKQHEDGIGGTRLVRILGLVPKTNALDVYHEMTRPQPDTNGAQSIDLTRGKMLEDMARQHFWAATGWRGRATRGVLSHPDFPATQVHTDFEIFADPERTWKGQPAPEWMRGPGVGETKAPRSAIVSRIIDDGLRQSEVTQAYFYGAVRRWSWACMNYFTLEHDAGPTIPVPIMVQPHIAKLLLETAQRFMDEHVAPRIPPDPDEWRIIRREDLPEPLELTGELTRVTDEEAREIGERFIMARDLKAQGEDLYERAGKDMEDWLVAHKLKRVDVDGPGKFTLVTRDGQPSFSESSLALARPLDWDLVMSHLLGEGYTEEGVVPVLESMVLDLERFRRVGDPFRYVLPPRRPKT